MSSAESKSEVATASTATNNPEKEKTDKGKAPKPKGGFSIWILVVFVAAIIIIGLVIAFVPTSSSSSPTGSTGSTGTTGTTGLTGGQVLMPRDGFALVRDSSELMGRDDSEFWGSRGVEASSVFGSLDNTNPNNSVDLKGKTVILKRNMDIHSLNVEGGQLFLNGFSLRAHELIAIGAEIYAGTTPSKSANDAPSENLVDSQNNRNRPTIDTIVTTLANQHATQNPKMDVLAVKTLVYDPATRIYTSANKDLIFVTQSVNTPTVQSSPISLKVMGRSNVHRILL